MCHVTLIHVLLLTIFFSKDTVTEDTSDKTTSEKERPGLTPEPEGRTSTRGPRNSGVQKKLEFKGDNRILSFAS